MADENEVRLPYDYYPDPTRGRPVYNGFIYIGKPDTDPQVVSNRLQVRAFQENGSSVPIAQPIRTGAGGVPDLNGSSVQLQVSGEYSIKVLDHLGAQVYYAPSIIGGIRPTTIVRTQFVPLSINLTNRFINSNLFDPNTTGTDYYALHPAAADFGDISVSPFNIENIPAERFDLAAGSGTVDLGGLT
ncbi:Head binding [Pseudomonas sp. NFPP05]|uniref:phage tailspike protein n=1 Tax=unclassified Pseudomonas TaxID=196821 RepID=UPI00088DD08B|nr:MULTISPECIES: phage tailspike protein [unclassified Pseudomonas]SDA11214.1 Head binding [Pseudomonas sp. NFPP12]SFM12388.1 Head binding [Pseudomonas sp. NFPP05]